MRNLIKFSTYLFALLAIFFVSNFVSSNIAFSAVADITNIAFITEPKNIAVNEISGAITIHAQDISGSSEKMDMSGGKMTINVSSGEISASATTWENISAPLTVNSNWSGRTVYYKNSNIGVYTITAILVIDGKSWTATQDITVGDSDEDDTDDSTSTTTATTTETIVATSTATTTTTTVISVHYIQESVSDYEEPTNIFELGVGRERLSYVGSPVNFQAKYKTSSDLKNKTPKYAWSLGDGFISSDKEVVHIYKYPGDYNVVLNANIGDINSVSRTKVKIVIPEIILSVTTGGEVEVTNKGNYEINLYGLKMKSENQEYSFPLDTIISAKSSVVFPSEYLGLFINSGELSLVDSQEKILSQINPKHLVVNPEKMVSFEEFQKFALEYRKSISAPVPPNSNQINQVFVNNVSSSVPVNSDIPMTASAVSAFIKSTSSVEVGSDENNKLITENNERGFWSKIFHPIRTIQESFY